MTADCPTSDPMKRIFAALGDRVRPDDHVRADLPVGLIHDDVVAVRGSILVSTRRVVSRDAVNKAIDNIRRR